MYKKSLNNAHKMLPRYTEVLIVGSGDFPNKAKGCVVGGSVFKDRPHYCVYLYREEQSYYVSGEFLQPTGVTKTAADFDKPTATAVPSFIQELDLA